jgi:hypothetical protein
MLIATSNQVFEQKKFGDEIEPLIELGSESVACVAEGESCCVVIRKTGICEIVSVAGVEQVSLNIERPIECLQILEERPLRFLVGTEGPHIFDATADTCRPIESFDLLEERASWYTPWGGPASLRSFATTKDGWIYADIHVGSIMRSRDNGNCWEPVVPELHEDVHQVATTPLLQDRLYANTARGVYLSEDRGNSWVHRSKDLPVLYGRSIAVDPEDPDCLLASVSTGPHGDATGYLYRSQDAGQSWKHVEQGFPSEIEGNIDTFHLSFAPDRSAWVCVGSSLYTSLDSGESWQNFWTAPNGIRMITNSLN